MRRLIHPLSYSAVSNPAGGHYDKTECVKDNHTGLIWEGKVNQSGHLRHYANLYTNWDNNQPGDAGAYVAEVNTQGLCGFNDWRLPTVRELQGLVDYGKPSPGPTIDTHWFPHTWTSAWNYGGTWASDSAAGHSARAWGVNFGYGSVVGGSCGVRCSWCGPASEKRGLGRSAALQSLAGAPAPAALCSPYQAASCPLA
ncbi:DUF1566 domain-containing protein [Allofranklinella schreckenbergeri]|uniref:DUF1566 domain-containing protein n=2 Tax=Allofranklinella schreckenbergeri TaxID=1076744 RepID=A0A3M6QBL8_9BURK|nr:DUF1566 domain-containing protein [Allofranklinella schreckenbergeri]